MCKEKNYFEYLNSINVNDKVEKKNGLSYLAWAWAWGEIKKRHPDAFYTIYENADGWFYFTDGRTCWVKTGVTVNGIEHIEYLPVMDNRNKSIPLASVTSFDVNKAVQRSLTKACARHGLGLYIYAGEDLPEDEKQEQPQTEQKKPQTEQKVLPSKEQLEELNKLGGSIQIAATYYKVEIEDVTAEMVQKLIDKKKKSIAKEQDNANS